MYGEGLCLALRLLLGTIANNVTKAREELMIKSSKRGVSRSHGELLTISLKNRSGDGEGLVGVESEGGLLLCGGGLVVIAEPRIVVRGVLSLPLVDGLDGGVGATVAAESVGLGLLAFWGADEDVLVVGLV